MKFEKAKINHDHVLKDFWDHKNGYENIKHQWIIITNFPKSKTNQFSSSLQEIEDHCINTIGQFDSGHFYYFIYDCNYEAILFSDLIKRW